jgi:hypothetical protein
VVGEMDDSDWSRIRAWILMKGFTDRHPLVLVAAGSDAANMCAVMGSRCCESGSQRERGLVKLGWGGDRVCSSSMQAGCDAECEL